MASSQLLLLLLLLLLQLLGWTSLGSACFCERYPWGPWSACSRTCNHGVQHRQRNFQYDDYYWKSSCSQLCRRSDSRGCSQQSCPINCLLGPFSSWSTCSPCAKKQFRTRSVLRPSQFGGSACSVELVEERPCHPSSECKLAPISCKDGFQCDNGRCVNQTLTCNKQNDCGDNSDERDCASFTTVCPAEKRVAPGADLLGNGFDALAEEPRGAVLDNMFMGAECTIRRPPTTTLYHRIPHNFASFNIKVGVLEDFSTEPRPLRSESINLRKSVSSERGQERQSSFRVPFIFLPLFFNQQRSMNRATTRVALDASKKTDSKFLRVHQDLPVSTFRMRDSEDLVLSQPFLQFLHALPLEYNYALYREIFQRFGTHYYHSGVLGGRYDLLYQYSREQLQSSGTTEEHLRGCLAQETSWTVILYSQHSSVLRCSDNRMTEKFQGSYIQAAEKSYSLVRGGRAREAAALAWERQGPTPDRTSYRNWAKSVLDNPAVVESQVSPLIDLVKRIPCAVTKRRHLRRALLQYLDEFDSCRCAPCPNNARAVLSGTECTCVCQTGTFGSHCEQRAPDYTSESVDGSWSCWGPWSSCGSTMQRHRSRRCDNPAPLRGGQPCSGPSREQDPCHVSIFQKQETCDEDEDVTIGWRDELPPGVQGCLRPPRPPNSFLRKAKQYYDFGEDEEFQCYTGFDLEGFQFINCLPDGTWTQPQGQCLRKVCLPLDVPEDMTLHPSKDEYRLGDALGLNCKQRGLFPVPVGSFTCGPSLTWEPAPPADLRCSDEEPFVPDGQCAPGRRLQGSECVCVTRQSCLSQPADLCVLNTDVGVAVSMSLCSFHAGRCHGDPLFFISEGVCDEDVSTKLEWAKFRAQMSSRSPVQERCGLDTCYQWETCSASQKCECKAARNCERDEQNVFCIKLSRSPRPRTLDLCSMAALKCAKYEFEVVSEGVCGSR